MLHFHYLLALQRCEWRIDYNYGKYDSGLWSQTGLGQIQVLPFVSCFISR